MRKTQLIFVESRTVRENEKIGLKGFKDGVFRLYLLSICLSFYLPYLIPFIQPVLVLNLKNRRCRELNRKPVTGKKGRGKVRQLGNSYYFDINRFLPLYESISTRLRSHFYPATIRFIPGYDSVCIRLQIDLYSYRNRFLFLYEFKPELSDLCGE
jgi:hypothetical protein